MIAIKVDENRDIIMINGRFEIVKDIDVVLQNCDHAMRQQIGELDFNALKGIDYTGNIFSNTPNYQRFEAQARKELLNVNGVTGVVTFSYSIEDDALKYSAEISTIYGNSNIGGAL